MVAPRDVVTAAAAAAACLSAGAAYVAGRSRPVTGRKAMPEPPRDLPPGRVVAVPGRGEFFVRESPGPQAADGRPAPTVVLLHGWMVPADLNWFSCYAELSRLARVVAVDHRGHGRGPRPGMPFRLADVADDVAALLRHLDTGPVVAVGYSMGGTVAQLLWQRHPDSVAGLVLCATSASFSATAVHRWRWRLMGVLQLLLRVLPRTVWDDLLHRQARGRLPVRISRTVHPEARPEVLALLPWIVGELDRGSAEDIAEAGRELGRYDARGWVGSIDVPCAVLISCKDDLVPERDQRDLAGRVPDCFVLELPIDHAGVTNRPDLFVPALVKAVEHVWSSGPRP